MSLGSGRSGATLDGRSLPQTLAADERVRVIAGAAARRQRLQLVNVAAPEHDVLGLERGDQPCDDVHDVAPPWLEPVRLQPVQSDVLLECSVPVRQVTELHRLDKAVDDHRGAETGAEPEKQHLAAAVTPEGLHCGVIHDLDRTPKRRPIVEPNPAAAEMTWLRERAAVDHRPWIADGHRVVRPLRRDGLDALDHLPRGERGSGRKLTRRLLSGDVDLHVSAADIHDQHAHTRALSSPWPGRSFWPR